MKALELTAGLPDGKKVSVPVQSAQDFGRAKCQLALEYLECLRNEKYQMWKGFTLQDKINTYTAWADFCYEEGQKLDRRYDGKIIDQIDATKNILHDRLTWAKAMDTVSKKHNEYL